MLAQGGITAPIEPKDNPTEFKFRGMVSVLDTQARTFDIGGQHFSYAGMTSGADALRNGALVSVVVAMQPNGQGRWVVTKVGNSGPGGGDKDQAKARGVITAFSSNSNFMVDGFTVDASAAQIQGGPLAAGLRVKVDGRLQAGVLIAATVEVQDNNKHDDLELRGAIATLDTVAKVFTISGHSERVSYATPSISTRARSTIWRWAARSVRRARCQPMGPSWKPRPSASTTDVAGAAPTLARPCNAAPQSLPS